MYIFNTDTTASIRSQCFCLSLVMSGYLARAQNSFYHFWTAVTCETLGLLAVAAFLELSEMPTAD